jgi:segregation and condensation protein B
MSKKKNKFAQLDKTSVNADLTNLIDAAKNSLFELDSSYSFIEEEKTSSLKFEDESETVLEAAVENESPIVDIDINLDIGVAEASVDLDAEMAEEDEKNNIEITEASDDFNLLESAFESQSAVEQSVEAASLEGTELEAFESAQIEELEFISDDQLQSVVESILFATDRPVSMATIKQVFVGISVTNARIRTTIENLKSYYANAKSGVTLDDVGAGFQLRTKLDNLEFLRRSLKARPFKLSGPALEVLAIVAYKQPIIKSEIDEIRGVESGHLLRALMEKNLCTFAGKSELPGKPMLYETTRKFLEIFSLRNLKELPTLSQIDELLPEGIGDEADAKPRLHDITDGLSQQVGMSYSEGEDELTKITGQLEEIQTSTDFFEQEKLRQKEQKEAEKAQNIRDALAVGETVSSRDANWLKRYDEQKLIAENGGGSSQTQVQVNEEDSFKPEAVAEVDNEFDELSLALDSIDAEESLVDAEVLEANDLADIDG